MVKKIDGRAARDLAFELFDQGKRPSNPEVKALGLKTKTTYNYFQDWKKLGETTSGVQKGSESSPPQPKKVVGGSAIEVGKITISPENWGMTQYGAILILDTYKRVESDLGYTGSSAISCATRCRP